MASYGLPFFLFFFIQSRPHLDTLLYWILLGQVPLAGFAEMSHLLWAFIGNTVDGIVVVFIAICLG